MIERDEGRSRCPATVVIIAPDMHLGGSVGSVAWRHALGLAALHRVYVITRAVPARPEPGIKSIIVRSYSWNWLRRFGHVPRELSFLCAARRALRRLTEKENIDLVWCHSHAVTAL